MHLYPWVQMVMFSELAPFGPSLHHAQRLPGPAEEEFQEMAREHKLWLVPGSLYEKRDGAIYNTTPVINPQGEVIARYRKMFPFTPLEEGVTPGEEFCVFDVPDVGRFAVLNCYDIWFPETTRTVTAMGAEVILHPVMTHTIDRDVDLAVAKAVGRDVPVLHLRHQRPGRRRQRPVLRCSIRRAACCTRPAPPRSSSRSRSTSTRCATSASAACAISASR